MRNSIVFSLAVLCLLAGCASNYGHKGESLEKIRSRHKEMVQGYKYGSVARGFYDEKLEAEAMASPGSSRNGLYLLAIGVDDYKQLPDLEGAIQGALMFALTLKKEYGFQVKVLKNPTRAETIATIRHYQERLCEDSQLVVYYAGHGWVDEASGQGYWLLRDAQVDSQKNWLSLPEITSLFRDMDAEKVMVVSDSCHIFSPQSQHEEFLRAADLSQQDEAQKVRVAITSGSLAPAKGENGSKCSVFVQDLLNALQNNQKSIRGADLHAVIINNMSAPHPSPQYAILPESGHQGGDFVFVPLTAEKVTQLQ